MENTNEGTVTISLQRYKELEGYEKDFLNSIAEIEASYKTEVEGLKNRVEVEEGYCYGGGDLPFTKKGLVNDTGELEDALNVLMENGYDVSSIHAQTNIIKAVRDTKGVWRFETEIPHKTFNVMEDGELSSVGIAFRMEDVK